MASGSAVKLRSFTRPRTPCGLPISPTRMRRPAPTATAPLRVPALARRAAGGGRGRRGRALLRLLLRRGPLRPVAELRHRREARLAEELRHALRRQRAVAEPVADALVLQPHAVGVGGGQ